MVRLELLTTEDAARWRALLPASTSVWGSVEFSAIHEEHTGHSARLLACLEAGVVYPCFLRAIQSLPFARGIEGARFDLATPEFTGPLGVRPPADPVPDGFADAFTALCRQEGIVTEFAHLHPWNAATEVLRPSGLRVNREIVYVDLTLSEEDLWKDSLNSACRDALRRARRHGVQVIEASEPAHVREFHRVYASTMDRRVALGKYYRSPSYFLDFFTRMPKHVRFALAQYQGKTVAAFMYLLDATDAYGFLAGMDYAYRHVYPMNAAWLHAILQARAQGKRRFILGGGYQPDDGVFRFKAGFSPLRAAFRVYRQVHLGDTYAQLSRAWAEHYGRRPEDAGYFPAYREQP